MSLFSTILNKLGLGKKPEAPATTAATAAKPAAPAMVAKPAAPPPAVKPAAPVAPKPMTDIAKDEKEEMERKHEPAAAPAPTPISEVDVVNKLEALAKGSGLDWKVSIVDLLKLLEIDSSRESRNELAKELGCPEEFMKDSAKMNTWLHKEVLRKIAANGGNIPKELLD
jgi:hypothetical protein